MLSDSLLHYRFSIYYLLFSAPVFVLLYDKVRLQPRFKDLNIILWVSGAVTSIFKTILAKTGFSYESVFWFFGPCFLVHVFWSMFFGPVLKLS